MVYDGVNGIQQFYTINQHIFKTEFIIKKQMVKKISQEISQTKNEENKSSMNNGEISGVNGEEESSSTIGHQIDAILKEELNPSTIHYYSAPVVRAAVSAVSKICTEECENDDNTINRQKICNKSKSIKIKKSIANRHLSASRRPVQSIDPQPQRRARKINHRKYTVKKCSNFLRKSLKKDGFKDFKKLQGQRNRRGSTIYLAVGLLIMRSRNYKRFLEFVQKYLIQLDRLQAIEERKFRANRNEKSQHYIIQFKRAKAAIRLFASGDEIECIKKFFGAHEQSFKEQTYLEDSIDFYNQWKTELGGSTLELQEFEVQENKEVEMMEFEMVEITTPIYIYSNESLEYQFNSYFSLQEQNLV